MFLKETCRGSNKLVESSGKKKLPLLLMVTAAAVCCTLSIHFIVVSLTLGMERELLIVCALQIQNKMKAAVTQTLQILEGFTGRWSEVCCRSARNITWCKVRVCASQDVLTSAQL